MELATLKARCSGRPDDLVDVLPDVAELCQRPAWQARAACRGTRLAAFFPQRGETVDEAKATCDGCPVCSECLETALADPELRGVWGGTSERQRRQMRRERASPALQECSSCRERRPLNRFGWCAACERRLRARHDRLQAAGA